MLKKLYVPFLFFYLLFNSVNAQSSFKTDSLLNILKVNEESLKQRLLVEYIKNNLLTSPIDELNTSKTEIGEFLTKYNIRDKAALEYFSEGIYQQRLSYMNDSENAMIKAIQLADKAGNSFLSYTLLNYLASLQTDNGNVIGAVSSYRMAKKNAIKLDDTNLQMITDINISDVYYKNSFYGQSLFYLGQAQAIADKFWPDDQRVKNIIYYNKAENFFRTNNADSLKFYNEKLKTSKANTYKLYTYKKRTDYYLSLLHSDYKRAINLIHAMQNDEGFKSDDEELQNLADAYYKNGQPDSAEFTIKSLLSNPSQANHPENKYHLYEVLGDIAGQRADYKSAADYFKLSLQQSTINMNRLTQVGNISSLIKTDEIQEYYLQKSRTYSRERLWLIIIILLALITILVITMFYRTVKQKRHYESLLFETKKRELAFINSHEVRRYLANILGLIEVLKLSKKPEQDYLEVEEWLYSSSKQLDEAIKNIAEKIDE